MPVTLSDRGMVGGGGGRVCRIRPWVPALLPPLAAFSLMFQCQEPSCDCLPVGCAVSPSPAEPGINPPLWELGSGICSPGKWCWLHALAPITLDHKPAASRQPHASPCGPVGYTSGPDTVSLGSSPGVGLSAFPSAGSRAKPVSCVFQLLETTHRPWPPAPPSTLTSHDRLSPSSHVTWNSSSDSPFPF